MKLAIVSHWNILVILAIALLVLQFGSAIALAAQQQGNSTPVGANKKNPIKFNIGCAPGPGQKPLESNIDAGSDAKGDKPVKKGPDHKIWEEEDKNGRLVLYCIIDKKNPSLTHYQLVWIPEGGEPVMIGRCPFPRNGVNEGYGRNEGSKTIDEDGNVTEVIWTSRATGHGYSAGGAYKDIVFVYDVKNNKLTTTGTTTEKEDKKIKPKPPPPFDERDASMPYPWLAGSFIPPMGDPASNTGLLSSIFAGPCVECRDEAILVPPELYNYIQELHEKVGASIRQRTQWELDVRVSYPIYSGTEDFLGRTLTAQRVSQSGLAPDSLLSDVSLDREFNNGLGANANIDLPLSGWLRVMLVTDFLYTDESLSGLMETETGPISVDASYRVYAASEGAGLTLGRTSFWNIRPKLSAWLGAGMASAALQDAHIIIGESIPQTASALFDEKTELFMTGGASIGIQVQLLSHWSIEGLYEWRGSIGHDPDISFSTITGGLSYNW